MRVIRTKAVGVTFTNEDGTKRQRLIRRRCRPGTVLRVVPEPENPADPDAVGLWADGWLRWRRVGYLKAGLAADLAGAIDGGARVRAVVTEVTGTGWFRSRGLNLELTVEDAPAEAPGGGAGSALGAALRVARRALKFVAVTALLLSLALVEAVAGETEAVAQRYRDGDKLTFPMSTHIAIAQR